MKALKNPLIALILCAAIILTSTCLNAKIGLEKRYDKICDRVYSEILEFAGKNNLPDLELRARAALAGGDCSQLIEEFNINAVGFDKKETASVDKAVKAYASFMRDIGKFPAKQLISLLHITF